MIDVKAARRMQQEMSSASAFADHWGDAYMEAYVKGGI